MGEEERDRAVADLPAEFLGDQRLEIRFVVDDEDLGAGHPIIGPRERGQAAIDLGLQQRRNRWAS